MISNCMSGGALQIDEESYWCRDYRRCSYSYEDALKLVMDFHGNPSPGLVLGVKMVTYGIEHIPAGIPFDVVCEARGCLPDAVQILTPCTVGNGRLKINDLGRYALAMYDKTNGRGVRVSVDPVKVHCWPVLYDWFLEIKPMVDLNMNCLMSEIRNAGTDILKCRDIEMII